MISKVILKNWRSHFRSELEFSEGTNCLIGRMGSGKSSVMDAICFGLFGTFPALQQRKIKLEDVVMKKPKRQLSGEVEILFDINNDTYSVKRTIEKGRSSSELRKNGQLIEAPQSQKVTEEIEKLLKMDYDLFTRAVYSEQNQLDMFLTIPKGQRMKKIDGLLKLDKFGKARSSAISLLNRFESALEEIEKFMDNSEAENVKKQVIELEHEIEEEKKNAEEMRKKIEFLDKQIKTKKEEAMEYESKEKEITRMNIELTALIAENKMLKAEIDDAEKLLSRYGNIEDSEKSAYEKYKLTKSRIEAMRSEIEAMQKEFTEKSVTLESLKKKFSELEISKNELEKIREKLNEDKYRHAKRNFEECSNKINEKKVLIKSIDAKISELGKSTRELEKSGSHCPVCYQNLTEQAKKEIIERNNNLASDLNSKKAETEKELIELMKQMSEFELICRQADAYEKRLAAIGDVEGEYIRVAENIKTIEEFIAGKKPEIDRKKTLFEQERLNLEKIQEEISVLRSLIEKSMEAKKKRDKHNENMEKINELQKKISLISFDKDKLNSIRKEIESLLSEKASVSGRLESVNIVYLEKQKRIDELKKKSEILEKYKTEYRKTKGIIEQLKLLEKALLTTQIQLRKNFVTTINQVMHEMWQEIYPYSDFSSVRLAVNGDYVLELEDMNGWVSVDSVSGGERSIACLVLRIAFALVLAPQLRWLVLDEPTHNLDSKAVSELARILKEKISEYVDQVFIITHDPALENAVSGCLYKFEKDDFTRAVRME